MKKIKLFKNADVILILIITAICAISLAFLSYSSKNRKDVYAYIYVSGIETAKIDLNDVSESYEIPVDCNPKLTVSVEKGRICIKDANCPDKLCVNSGWLQKNFDTAVCLPANVIVTVRTSNSDNADVITY